MAPPPQQAMQQQQHAMQQRNGSRPGGSQAYPGVSTQGLPDIGYGEQATQLESETQQQNHYLDEISKGLDQLKFGAQVSQLSPCAYRRWAGNLAIAAQLMLQRSEGRCIV